MKVLLHFPDVNAASTSMLARALIERGHHVVYSAIDDEDGAGCPPGATRMLVHARWPMRKLLARLRDAADAAERDWLRLEIDAFIARDYFDGDTMERVKAAAPDIIVADSALLSPLQFVARALRVPCVQLSLTFSRRWSAGPPFNSSLRMTAPALQLAGARWQGSCLNRRILDVPAPMQVAASIERLAISSGYPSSEVSFDAAQVPALTLFPEMIACEASLDFGPNVLSAEHYLAIEPARTGPQEVPAALSAFVDPDRPLIYIALSGADLDRPGSERIWPPLQAALAERAPWKTVVVTGSEAAAARLAVQGDDVLVLAQGPRSWLLQRAAALVTTGELEAIRAAIAHQVPVIAMPLRDDQPGNAERVVHHAIGVRLRAELLTARVFNAAVRGVLEDLPRLRQNLLRLDHACREERARQRGVAILEKLGGAAPDDTRRIAAHTAPAPRPGLPARLDELRHATGPDEMWFDYATWCVEQVLEPLWACEPDRVEAFRDLLARYRDLRRERSDPESLARLRRSACERAAPHWHKGYGALVCALHPDPQRGAWLARLEVAAVLARAAAGAHCDEERSQRFTRRYAEVSRQLDAELELRLGGRARVAR